MRSETLGVALHNDVSETFAIGDDVQQGWQPTSSLARRRARQGEKSPSSAQLQRLERCRAKSPCQDGALSVSLATLTFGRDPSEAEIRSAELATNWTLAGPFEPPLVCAFTFIVSRARRLVIPALSD